MRCGLLAEDCAVLHWSPPLEGEREGSAWRWRAPCPVCRAKRSLEYSLNGKSLRWRSFCGHDRDALRPVLRKLLGDCLPGRAAGRPPVTHEDLAELMLTPMPPTALRLAGLEMAGFTTQAALDKLGVRRENRSRVIADRASALMQTRR